MTDDVTAHAARLLEILDLENVEQNLYLGQNEPRHTGRLFGGQVLAQAAVAAYEAAGGAPSHRLRDLALLQQAGR